MNKPTWIKSCSVCDETLKRFPGEGDIRCPRCSSEYNTFGQRLRANWDYNVSHRDEDVSDMDGYEASFSDH